MSDIRIVSLYMCQGMQKLNNYANDTYARVKLCDNGNANRNNITTDERCHTESQSHKSGHSYLARNNRARLSELNILRLTWRIYIFVGYICVIYT